MMKKLFFFGMMGAMALTFAACSSEDEVAVNPTYDGKAVKTQFAFNVSQGQFTTRMTQANVQGQATPVFLGLDNMTLFAFTGTPADASELTTSFELGSIGKTITLENTNKFYTLQIPVGTDNFVFYGEAPEGDEEANGVLINNISDVTTLGAIEFTLDKRAADDLFTGTTATGIIAKLNAIANATGQWTETVAGVETDKTKAWKDTEDLTLKTLYTNFTNAGTGKIRAGYDAAIQRIIDDLEAAAVQLKTTGLNQEVKAIATAIETACKDYTVPTFPGAKMPKGAAQLEWTGTAFQFKAAPDAFKTTSVDPMKIAYPAKLVYWDNSPLRATDLEKKEADYPNGLVGASTADGYKAWFPDASWTKDWVTGAVKASTRAIAMKENVNYGVAGLHTTVSWTNTNYADNTKALVTGATADQTFAVDGDSFTLTGILVGGQPSKANWQMLPAAGTTADPTTFDWVVYDNKLNATNEIYTLLLDNYQSSLKTVRVALEFTNNLEKTVTKTDGSTEQVPADFYGVDGIIPAGGTFYLVAELKVPAGTTSWATAYENTRIQNAIRIFAQDRMTEASFKFSTDALKHAYETIPDLQSVSMLFGLSVDIKWLPGLVFSNVEL